jgi:pimeloyl-ACP methyl ester carboxylesterase
MPTLRTSTPTRPIEAGIPRARRIVIRGVGHLMYLEKPDEFARTVIAFIEANP